jgi:hypothetical protein
MSSSIYPVPFSGIQETKLTTTGDTLYASAANTPARLGIGTTGQVLTVAGGVPTWATPAGAGGTWQAYTPTLNQITLGNGTLSARYTQTGKTVSFWIKLTQGSTTTWNSSYAGVTLPFASPYQFVANLYSEQSTNGSGVAVIQAGGDQYIYLRVFSTGGTYASTTSFSSGVPVTWTTGNYFHLSGTYEVS